jgi:hypothetical protein
VFSLGALALGQMGGGSLLGADAPAVNPLAPKAAPLPAKAKSVIYLHMSGAPAVARPLRLEAEAQGAAHAGLPRAR